MTGWTPLTRNHALWLVLRPDHVKTNKKLKTRWIPLPFSTLIWKNISLIWSISAQSCDVIGIHLHINIIPASISAWFLKKNMPHIISYLQTKFHFLIGFISWYIGQCLYFHYLMSSLRVINFEINHNFLIKPFST